MTGRPFSNFTDEYRRQLVVQDARPALQPQGAFGPFRPNVPEPERWAGLRALAALVSVFAGSSHPAVAALRRAESDPTTAGQALAEFDRVPTLRRRQIIATYARIMSPEGKRWP